MVGMERVILQMEKVIPLMEKADLTGLATRWELPRLAALRLRQALAPLRETRGVLSCLAPQEQAPCPCFALRLLWSLCVLHFFAMDPSLEAVVAGRVCLRNGCCWDPGQAGLLQSPGDRVKSGKIPGISKLWEILV